MNIDAEAEAVAGQGRIHHRPPPAGDLLRRGCQGNQLERDPAGRRDRRGRTPVGVPALLQGGQPSINWLDPSFAGMRLVIGDALHSLTDLGAGALRLDANGFLGVEKSAEGSAGLVGGPPAFGGGQPSDREHGAQDGRLHLPGTEPHYRRHREIGDAGADSPTTSSTGPPIITRWSPATPSSCV